MKDFRKRLWFWTSNLSGKAQNVSNGRLLKVLILLVGLLVGVSIGLLYVNRDYRVNENPSLSYSKYTFGIDVSSYQGSISWKELLTSHHPIKFVFIRATMGVDGRDRFFHHNWRNARKSNLIRGAYHYYRPNENSTQQFKNFASRVKLEQGDLPPVLDVEVMSRYGADNLRAGVLNWLKLAEKEYSVKPILYTGRNFYLHHLKGHVEDYPLWIASYSGKHRLNGINWTFHQFTDRVRVRGVRGTVDGNDFKMDIATLKEMCIK